MFNLPTGRQTRSAEAEQGARVRDACLKGKIAPQRETLPSFEQINDPHDRGHLRPKHVKFWPKPRQGEP